MKIPQTPAAGPAPTKPRTIDEYLAPLDEDQRAALQKLRKTIHAAAPGAEECISYGLAAFRLNGVLIAGLGAAAGHCAYYPMSGRTVDTLKDELAGYETSKGTIRFKPDKPLLAALVRKLIKARLAETTAGRGRSRRREAAKEAAKGRQELLKKRSAFE